MPTLSRRRYVKVPATILILAILFFFFSSDTKASPAYPVVKTFEQPDGTTLELRLWGDEFANGQETLDGFTVIKNSNSGYWEYAMLEATGHLVPSGVVVGKGFLPVARSLRPSLDVYNESRAKFGLPPLGEPRIVEAPGWAGPETDVLFIMIEFTDVGCSFTDTQMQTNLFGGGATGPGDLDDYFDEISYGALDMVGWVEGGADCYTAANTHTHYDNGPGTAADLVREAVNLADPDIDFSLYDNDGDGDVDVLGVIYAGGGPHDGCEDDDGSSGSSGDNLWPHKSSLGVGEPADGVVVNDYIIQSEITWALSDGVCDEIQTIGLFAHEFGHAIGLPDLYDTDNSSNGVGFWSTMGSQYRSTVTLADTPPHYDPWSKWFEGWISPVDYTGMDMGVGMPQVETNPVVAQLLDNPGGVEIGGTGEYFLVENRQQTGFDAQLPGCGLLAWHLEESQTHNQNEGHTTASHRLVDVEEADGQDDLDRDPATDPQANRGDSGDPFPGSTNNMLWDDSSTPHARLYDGSGSGVSMEVISEDCTPNMLINFGSPNVDLSISKTASPNPVIAGEQLLYYISVTNNGPGIASNVLVTDTLPVYVTHTANTGNCTSMTFGTLTCSRDSLAPGETWSFSILTTVHADAVSNNGGVVVLINKAIVGSDQIDSNPFNNNAMTLTYVNELADVRVTKDCKPDVPVPTGGNAYCRIWVRNLGPSTARGVTAVDDHFSNGTFTLGPINQPSCVMTPNPQVNDGQVTCNVTGGLDPGEVFIIVIGVGADEPQDVNDQVTVSSITPDPKTNNNQASDGLNFVATSDLSLTKTAAPNPVVAGTQLIYSLQVSNLGPATAPNVVVEDFLPARVSIDSVVATGGASCNVGVPGNPSQPTTCAFASLAASTSQNMTIVVTVLPNTTGILHNDAEVSSDAVDPNNANNLASTDTVVTGDADLSVSIVDNPDPVIAGALLNYDVTITNNGPSAALDVSLEDTLSSNVSFLNATISNGSGSCILLNGITLSCDLNDLAPGAFVTVFIDVLVNPAVPNGAVIFNTATVSSTVSDSNPANNSETEDTTVSILEADLELLKTSDRDVYGPSDTIIYTIQINNTGPSDALEVIMVDDLPLDPQKIVYFYDSGDGACAYDEPSHSVTCDFGTLISGHTVSVDIYVKTKGSLGLITNIATVTTTSSDPNPANNTDTKIVLVTGGGALIEVIRPNNIALPD